MKSVVLKTVRPKIEQMLKEQVYVSRASLTAKLKRRGGFDFIPRKPSREHMFLRSINYTGKTVYDIGGFIGLMTIFFARAVGPTGRVVTFEPNPQNCAAIRDHLQLNHFNNVQIVQQALGRQHETRQFVVSEQRPAWGTFSPARQQLIRTQDQRVNVFDIEIDTLDHQIEVQQLPKPDFIKVDVEGLESDVIAGMEQTVNTYKPNIMVELHGGKGEAEVVEFLLAHNYHVYQVESGLHITPRNMVQIRGHLYAYS